MKIESLIKRKNGTKVDLDFPRKSYHFKPESGVFTDPHICDVEVESHAKSLLRIREGFRLVEGEEAPAPDEDTGRHLNGSSVHDAKYTIKGGDVIELEDLVNMAFDDSGLDEDQWNALDDQIRYEYIDTTLRELRDGFHESNADDSGIEQEDYSDEQEEKPKEKPEEKQEEKPAATDEPLDRKALAAQFKEKFGRAPSNRMKPEEIARALSEDEDE